MFVAANCQDLTGPSGIRENDVVTIVYTGPPAIPPGDTAIQVLVGDTIAPVFDVQLNNVSNPRVRYVYSTITDELGVLDIADNGLSAVVTGRGPVTLVATVVGATIGSKDTTVKPPADTITVIGKAAQNAVTVPAGSSTTLESFNQELTLIARSLNTAGAPLPIGTANVEWSTTDPAVAALNTASTVNTTSDTVRNIVTAVGNGTANIIAVFDDVDTVTTQITVRQRTRKFRLSSARFGNAAAITLRAKGDTLTFTPTAVDSLDNVVVTGSTPIPTPSFTTSEPGGVSIDAVTGRATAIANTLPGAPAQIRVQVNNENFSDPIDVTVRQVAKSILINGLRLDTLPSIGDSVIVTVTTRDSLNQAVPPAGLTWSSSVPGIVTIDGTERAVITAAAVGSTDAIVAADGISDRISLVVTNDPASVTLSPSPLPITSLNGTASFAAVIANRLGTTLNFTPDTLDWRSLDEAIATVSNTGMVTGLSTGFTSIIATTKDGSNVADTAQVVVTNHPSTILLGVPSGPGQAVDNFTLNSVGDTLKIGVGGFTFDFKNALGAQLLSSAADWQSSDVAVVRPTVDGFGNVVAVGPGSAYIKAISLGNPLVRDSILVTVTNSAATINVAPAAPTNLTSIGQTQTFTATAFNAAGNSVSVASLQWSVVAGGSFVSIDPVTGVATALASGTATIRASLGSVTSDVNLTVAQAISSSRSTVTATAPTLVADGATSTTITVQLKDANDVNIAASGGSTVVLSSTLGSLSAVTAGPTGSYTATLTTGTTTGAAIISGTVGGSAIANSANVAFTSGTAAKYIVTPNNLTPTAGGTVTIRAQLADVNNNPITGAGVTVTFTSTNGGAFRRANGGTVAADTTTDATGVATITFTTSATAAAHTITATSAGPLSGSSAPITSVAGAGANYSVTAATSSPAAGSAVIITAQLRDANGNAVATPGVSVTFSKSDANGSFRRLNGGTAAADTVTDNAGQARIELVTHSTSVPTTTTVTATSAGPITGTSANISTVAGTASAATTTISSNTATLTAGGSATITVQARDANGNLLSTSGGTVVLQTTLGSLSVVTDNGGTYTATLSTTTQGTATITGTINGAPITDQEVVTVNVTGATISIAQTTASVPAGTAGTATTITIQAKDQFGNNMGAGGSTIAVSVSGANTVASFNASDIGDGTYTAQYTPTAVGSDAITIRIGGTQIGGSPYTSIVGFGALNNLLVESSAGGSIPAQTAGSAFSVRLTARDANGNTVTNFTGTATVTSSGTLSGGGTTANFVNGVLTHSVTISSAGSTTLTASAAGQGGVSPASIAFNVGAAAATQIDISAGDGQIGVASAAVGTAPRVRVRDQFNNPVAGVGVTFAVASGNGSITGASQVTDASGLATVGSWTLGPSAGGSNNTLTATAGSLTNSPLTFTASATAATATVASASPNSGAQGHTGLNVTITGTKFAPELTTANVDFGGNGVAVTGLTWNSTTSITATLSIAAGATIGARAVTVTNPGGAAGSAVGAFTVVAPAAPALTALSPTSGERGQTLDVVFTGSNFATGVSSVNVGGADITVNSTTVTSATQLTANISIGATATLGARSFSVTNASGGGTSGNQTFTVGNRAATVTAVNPTSGAQGQTNLDITIDGSNFAPEIAAANVAFSGTGITVNSVTFNSATQIVANVSIASGAAATARTVTVTNTGATPGTLASAFTVTAPAAPTVASLGTTSGARGQTLDVDINGANYYNGVTTAASFGAGITVNSVTYVSATQVTANITVGGTAALGARSVTVTNTPGSTSAPLAASFTVVNTTPTVAVTSPNVGVQGQAGLAVTITGTGFAPEVATGDIDFGADIAVTGVTFNSTTSITATITIGGAAATGARNVVVTNATALAGTGTNVFTVNGPSAPTLASLSPTSGERGQTLDVVFTGTNFAPGVSSVNATGGDITVNSTTVNSATQLTANISIGPIATLGARNFSVTNAGAGTSANRTFTVANRAATVTGATPNTGVQGQTSLDVVIAGTRFAPELSAANVAFSGTGITVNSVTFTDSTSITANVSIASNATASSRTIAVTNAGATPGTATNAFTVTATAAPTVTSLGTTSGARGQTLDVDINGANYYNGVTTAASFGAGITVNSVTYVGPTQVTANITIGGTAALGARDVTVTNNPGSTSAPLATSFTIVNATPTVTATSPTSGAREQTGLPVTITGTGFAPEVAISDVDFGANITVTDVTFNSTTSITATISIGAGATLGARDVSVTNATALTGTGTGVFTVTAPAAPALTALSPTSGERGQTLDVVFTGSNFATGVSSVNVGGADITVNSTTVTSATQLTANISIGATATLGARSFSVTNASGGGTSGNQTFTVGNRAATVTAVNPTSGAQGQTNLDITIDGSNFAPEIAAANVAFSGTGITVNSVTFTSATQIVANVSIASGAAATARTVTVTNTGATPGTLASAFTVTAPAAPTLTAALSPAAGARFETLDVTFTGTDFAPGVTSVNVGAGITVNSVTVNSATSLTANLTISGTAALGARNFSVTNTPAGGTSGNQTFTIGNAVATVGTATPNTGNQGASSLSVALTGTQFAPELLAGDVAFSGTGITVNSVTFNSTSSLTLSISIGAGATTGLRDITVTNNGVAGGTASNAFTVATAAAPTISPPLSPTSGARGATLNVDIDGTNFFNGITTGASFGAGITVNSVSFVSSTRVRANITIDGAATLGTRDVTVTNTPGGTSTAAAGAFTVVNPAATVTTATPNTGFQGQTGLDVVIAGANFAPELGTSNVAFSGTGITVNSVTFTNANSITANITIASTAAATARTITVTNPGAAAGSAAGAFTVTAPASPTLTAVLSPATGARFQTLDVTFTGTAFAQGVTTVNVGADVTVNSVTVASATSLTANITIGGTAALGARNFSVTNTPAGGTSGNQTFTIGNAVATVGAATPNTGNQGASNLSVALTGTQFAPELLAGDVTFENAGITVNSVTFNSTSSLTLSISIAAGAATGAGDITVTNSGVAGGTATDAFTVATAAAPTITSPLSPTSGARGATLNVDIDGTNFFNGITTGASFGAGITVNSVSFVSSTRVRANITIDGAATLGTRDVTVTNTPGGTSVAASGAFTVVNPAASVTTATPSTGVQGETLDVVIAGSNFAPELGAANVTFSGTGVTVNSVTFTSANSITANITIAAGAATTARTITVTNPGAAAGSAASAFTVATSAAPTVTSLGTTSGARGQTLDVDINGANYYNGVTTAASFGAGITVNSITYVSATQVTANITIGGTAALGTRDVTVTNTPGSTSAPLSASFTVINTTPTVTATSPSSGARNQTGLAVTITGTGFAPEVMTTDVTFGGATTGIQVTDVTFNSTTSITATISIPDTATLGARNVSVTNATALTGTGTNVFTVTAPAAPTLTSLSPASGERGQTLNAVFTGTNFAQGVTTVNVGGDITVNSTTVNSATQLTANLSIGPIATLGARNFSVTNSAGGGTSGNQNFTVVNRAATVATATPNTGVQGQTNLDVVIAGSKFAPELNASNVAFSGTGITVNSLTFTDSTSITANISIASGATASARTITVTNAGATPGTATNAFTVTAPAAPTVASLGTVSGARGQTLDVDINGTNYYDGVTTAASFGAGITVNSVTYVGPTQITANITIGGTATLGTRDVTVTNNPGSTSAPLSSGFTVVNATPTVTATTPNSGTQNQTSLDVTITGTGFAPEVAIGDVSFGADITVNAVTFNSTTSITATISIGGSAATGARNVSVTNATALTGTGTNVFTVNAPAAPTLTSLSPSSGERFTSGLNVVLTGTNFAQGVSSVNIGGAGITQNSVTVNSPTQLTVNIDISGTADIGGHSFSVTNTGSGTSATKNFTVTNAAATVTTATPNASVQGQTGLSVAIAGTQFAPELTASDVSFGGNGVSVTGLTFNSTTSLTATISITTGATTGARAVSVTNSGAAPGSAAGAFTVNAGPNNLFFAVDPTNVEAQAVITPAVEVVVRDASNNPVTTDPNPTVTERISVALTTPGGATLGGTTTADINWTTGRATFNDLTVDLPATYTLTASEANFTMSITDGVSASFDVLTTTAAIGDTTNLGEADLDDGTIEVELTNGTFKPGVTGADFTLNNAPTGVTIENTVTVNSSTSVTLSLAFSGADFDNSPSNITVTVAHNALLTGSGPVTTGATTFTSAAANHIELTGSQAIATNTPTLYTVTAYEPNNSTMTVAVAEPLDLTNHAGGGTPFFSSDDAGTISIASVTIALGQNNATFYYKNSTAGTYTIRATDDVTVEGSALGFAELANIVVTATTAAITDPASTTEATLDAETITVELTNGTFDASIAQSDFSLTTAIPNLTIVGVNWDDATHATLTLDHPTDGSGDFDATETIAVNVLAGALATGTAAATGTIDATATAASTVAITADAGDDQLEVNETGTFTLTAKETNGTNMVVGGVAEVFELARTVGSGTETFSGATVTIAAGTESQTFTYANDATGSTTIRASDANSGTEGFAFPDATFDVTILTTTAAITDPASTTEAALNGETIEVTLTNGTYSGALVNGDFTLNTAIPTLAIASVLQNSPTVATITLSHTTTGAGDFDATTTISVTVNASALATGTAATTSTINADPTAASTVNLTGPSSVTAGQISTVFTLEARETNGTAMVVSGAHVFSLTADGAGTREFYNTSDTPLNPDDVTIADGTSSIQFKFSDTEANDARTVTATYSTGSVNLGSDDTTIDVNPDALDNFLLALSTPQTSGVALANPPNTLTARDQFNNVITDFDASANNVTFNNNGGGAITGLGSGGTNVLDQAGNFVSGVADLTGSLIYTGAAQSTEFSATSADAKTSNTVAVVIQ